MRSASMSRVMPALLTRMCERTRRPVPPPRSARRSRPRRAGRPGRRCARSPSSAASASSASRRVPDSATAAPWACSARAIAAPMPPEAPVTSAALPSSRNMPLPQRSSARLRSPPACAAEAVAASGAMRRISPDSTLPAPSSTKLSTPSSTIALTHSRQRTMAVTCRTSRSRISRRIGGLGGGDIGDQRHDRRARRGVLQRLGHRIGGGRHQRAVERGGDRQQHRPPHALGRGDRDGALDRAAMAGDRRSGRRRCRWPAG